MTIPHGVADALAARISTRAYLDTPVSEAQVRDLLTLAARAPSGGNLQPWQINVVTGEARQRVIDAVKATQAEHPFGEPELEYQIYPKPIIDPWRARRFACGEAVYAAMDIPREDKMARLTHVARNFEFFGAPVGLFVSIHKDMQPGQWSDLGMFIQSLLLAATEAGLGTCAQEAWSIYPKTVKTAAGIPADFTLFCGIALGHADPLAPVNATRTERADVDEFARFAGF
ncbi:nitroreductase [Maricaulis salignorans]|uniref:Nitroreductase n=1 Tax=Maricaulis salignorans TaxID=144026 RepID=A0A1G9PWD7_9PROT|nr:nitroreductase [Maricaulis salignorans]SDM03088.1 Nitroreductase [Maricaulis salignorans]